MSEQKHPIRFDTDNIDFSDLVFDDPDFDVKEWAREEARKAEEAARAGTTTNHQEAG